MVAWSAGCTLFQSHPAPAPRPQTHPAPAAPVTRLPPATRSARIRSAPVFVSKPSQPRSNLPQRPPVAPLVTLENSEDAKGNAQRLLEQASIKLARVNRAELAETTVSAYQQANELINAARRAMAEQDYLAASSLAEKASALTSQLPSQK
jgi:hypothetical protein